MVMGCFILVLNRLRRCCFLGALFETTLKVILFCSFVRSSAGSAGAEDEGATWFSGWFSWCPTSERLLEIAESQILESRFECF